MSNDPLLRLAAIANNLQSLSEQASPGPWKASDGYEQSSPGNYIADRDGYIVCAEQDDTDCVLETADRDLIVAARNSIPDLVAAIVELLDSQPTKLDREEFLMKFRERQQKAP